MFIRGLSYSNMILIAWISGVKKKGESSYVVMYSLALMAATIFISWGFICSFYSIIICHKSYRPNYMIIHIAYAVYLREY